MRAEFRVATDGNPVGFESHLGRYQHFGSRADAPKFAADSDPKISNSEQDFSRSPEGSLTREPHQNLAVYGRAGVPCKCSQAHIDRRGKQKPSYRGRTEQARPLQFLRGNRSHTKSKAKPIRDRREAQKKQGEMSISKGDKCRAFTFLHLPLRRDCQGAS